MGYYPQIGQVQGVTLPTANIDIGDIGLELKHFEDPSKQGDPTWTAEGIIPKDSINLNSVPIPVLQEHIWYSKPPNTSNVSMQGGGIERGTVDVVDKRFIVGSLGEKAGIYASGKFRMQSENKKTSVEFPFQVLYDTNVDSSCLVPGCDDKG